MSGQTRFYSIKQFSPLFFGKGPFSAGQHHESSFFYTLPTPETLYGAVRSGLAAAQGKLDGLIQGEFDPVFGSHTELGSLRVLGPVVVRDGELLLRMPDFIMRTRLEKDEVRVYLPDLKKAHTDLGPETLIPEFPEENDNNKTLERGTWMRYRHARQLFANGEVYVSENDLHKESDLFPVSDKTGIKLEEQGQVEEGMLYTRKGIETGKAVQLGFWMSGVDGNWPEHSFGLSLGGDGTPARAVEGQVELSEPGSADSNTYWMYLATPAVFDAGYLPPTEPVPGVEIEVLFAATGRPLSVSGFDMAQKRRKPLRLAVPPGSVFKVRLNRGQAKDLHLKCIGHNRNMTQKGFGLVFLFESKKAEA